MRVLVLEDEPIMMLNVQTVLLDAGHRPIGASTINEANAILNKRVFDAAIIDVSLPDGDSYEFAEKLKTQGIPFVLATGSYVDDRPEFGDVVVLRKPFDLLELEATLLKLDLSKKILSDMSRSEHTAVQRPSSSPFRSSVAAT